MPQILVRGLDAQIVKRLKARARSHGRSLEGEARSILESAATFTTAQAKQVMRRWGERLKGRRLADSVKLIREDRQR